MTGLLETGVELLSAQDELLQGTATSAIIPSTVDTLTATPELSVNLTQESSMIISDFLAQYIPALGNYSDTQITLSLGMILLWLLCIIRVIRDSSARSDSGAYTFFSVLLIILFSPILGLPLYLAFRPLAYKRDRGVWREALEQNITLCHNCRNLNNEKNKMCVRCGEALKIRCKQCNHHYSRQFGYCPECGAPNLE